MALTKCKECGKEVSKKATQCPSCGAPVKKPSGCLKLVGIAVIAFFVIGALATMLSPSDTATTPPPANAPPKATRPTPSPATQAQPPPQKSADDARSVIHARNNLPTNRVDITTRAGKIYERCKITRVEPDGISVMHSAGIAKLAFPDLPQEYQDRYGYSPAEAAAYRKTLAEAAQREQAAQAKRAAEKQATQAEQQAEQADEAFKKWALDNTAVTDIAIKGPTMFVTLTADKYTNEDNVQQIADALAKAYCMQTGKNAIVCRVYYGKRLYAKGDFYR